MLKILASNSKRFKVNDILKKKQIDDDRKAAAKYNIFFDNFGLK